MFIAKFGLLFVHCLNNLEENIFAGFHFTLIPQPFYGPFSGTTQVGRCQKRTSGLYGARED